MTKLMTPKRVILAALVLLMLWGGAMVYLSYQHRQANEPFLAECLLPDGVHKLRLLRIEEGLIEYHWKAPPRNRLLASILGNRDRLRDIHLKNSGYVPFNDWKPTSFQFRIVDEHGRWANPSGFSLAHFEFEDAHGYRFYDSGFPGDNFDGGAFLLHRTAFPRREKTIRLNLQFFGARPPVNNKWYPMEIPNPFYRTDFPVWKAEPLPTVHTAHGMTTRLLDHGYELRFFQPTLQRQVGPDQWNGCQLLFLRVEDATGNLMGDFHHAPLSPFEPVWKVTADIVPPADFLIPPHELQTLGPFTVPAVGKIELIGKSVTVADAKVTLIGICGGGTARKDAAGRWKGSPAVTPYGAHDQDPRSVTLSIG